MAQLRKQRGEGSPATGTVAPAGNGPATTATPKRS
jgi:hypothetical protein